MFPVAFIPFYSLLKVSDNFKSWNFKLTDSVWELEHFVWQLSTLKKVSGNLQPQVSGNSNTRVSANLKYSFKV